jgi:histidine triad (HIT) family protein
MSKMMKYNKIKMSEKSCTFCQIVAGKKPADIVYQDESVMAFNDIRRHAPVHLLIIPKAHIRSLNDLGENDGNIIAAMILKAREIAMKHPKLNSGYKLVFNVEQGGGQEIFHLHMHVLGGWRV